MERELKYSKNMGSNSEVFEKEKVSKSLERKQNRNWVLQLDDCNTYFPFSPFLSILVEQGPL